MAAVLGQTQLLLQQAPTPARVDEPARAEHDAALTVLGPLADVNQVIGAALTEFDAKHRASLQEARSCLFDHRSQVRLEAPSIELEAGYDGLLGRTYLSARGQWSGVVADKVAQPELVSCRSSR